MHFGTVSELWRYPVSSLTGERLDQVTLDEHGVERDRLWGLFDASDAVAGPESEKRWRPAPALSARFSGDTIEISNGGGWHALPSASADAAASARLEFPVRFAPFRSGAKAEELGAPRYERADLHILTTASMAKMRELLPNAVIDTRRFRPNIVVDTAEGTEGFAEQDLIGKTIVIGNARVTVTEPCTRCAFTALGQPGLPFDKDVLHAIARHGGGGFGVLAKVLDTGSIVVGDDVLIA